MNNIKCVKHVVWNKPVSAYDIADKKSGRRRIICRECVNKQLRERYAAKKAGANATQARAEELGIDLDALDELWEELKPLSKSCNKCNEDKFLDDFYKSSTATLGVNNICKECTRDVDRARRANRTPEQIESSREYFRKWNAARAGHLLMWKRANKDRVREVNHRYYVKNRDKVLEASHRYRVENRDNVRANYKRYYSINRDSILAANKLYRVTHHDREKSRRERYRNANKEKYNAGQARRARQRRTRQRLIRDAANSNGPMRVSDIHARIRIMRAIRGRIYTFLRSSDMQKSSLLGCDFDTIFLLFTLNFILYSKLGMSWDNYGSHWEIDHVVPCKRFDMSNPKHVRKCFNWTNLAPAPVSHNRSKGAKTDQYDIDKQQATLLIFHMIKDSWKQQLHTEGSPLNTLYNDVTFKVRGTAAQQ